jgi:hypothetical protein
MKETYNKYIPSDYEYGTESATTLNPVREVGFSQIEIIRRRLQEVTDDIIRKKIVKEPPPETPISVSLSPGALPSRNSPLRQAVQINTGSIGLNLAFPALDGPVGGPQSLLEAVVGTFPNELMLRDLDGPLAIDCKEILKAFDFAEDDDSDDNHDADESGAGNSTVSGIVNPPTTSTPDDSTDDGGEDISDYEACAMVEMEWLKIILIILKIIKILQTILDMILAILVPIFEIVMLALMCWLIPPSAEQLRQRITEMVMAIVIMIITKLIQMIFNLLNFDCLCDQTMDIINQIRQALSAFSSLMSVFDISAVTMMFGNFSDQVKDSWSAVEELLKNKKEAWDKMIKEWGDPKLLDKMWKNTKDQFINGAVDAVASNQELQKAGAAYEFLKDGIGDIISKLNKTKKAISGSGTAGEESDTPITLNSLITAPGFSEVEIT